MPAPDRELFRKVLLDTGLFDEPEGELRETFDLRGSGKECYLFASYGAHGFGYYLLDRETLLQPIGDEEAFYLPWLPISSIKILDLEEFELQLADPVGLRVGPPVASSALELVKKDRTLADSVLKEDKLIKLLPLEVPEKGLSYSKGVIRAHFLSLHALVEECCRLGVKPSDVLVLIRNPLDDESFYQYLAGVCLRKKNYLITEWPLCRPLLADIFGYRSKGFSNGAFLLELCLGLSRIDSGGDNEESSVLVEAESTPRAGADHSQRSGVGQASRYLRGAGGFFERGYVAAPMISHLIESEEGVGIITYDRNGRIRFKEAPAIGGFRVSDTVEDAESLRQLAEANAAIRQQHVDWYTGAPPTPAPKMPSFDDLYGSTPVRVKVTYSDGHEQWSGTVARGTARGIAQGTHKKFPDANVEFFPPSSGPPE